MVYTKKCQICKTEIICQKNSQLNKRKFCSIACVGKHNSARRPKKKVTSWPKKPVACEKCGKLRPKQNKHNKFCIKCVDKKGKNNPNWKGGVKTEQSKIRASEEYASWRKSVFERDGYKCVVCYNGGALHADHIKPFAYYPELRLDVSNGRTLCVPCHKLTDTYMSKVFKMRPAGYGVKSI